MANDFQFYFYGETEPGYSQLKVTLYVRRSIKYGNSSFTRC